MPGDVQNTSHIDPAAGVGEPSVELTTSPQQEQVEGTHEVAAQHIASIAEGSSPPPPVPVRRTMCQYLTECLLPCLKPPLTPERLYEKGEKNEREGRLFEAVLKFADVVEMTEEKGMPTLTQNAKDKVLRLIEENPKLMGHLEVITQSDEEVYFDILPVAKVLLEGGKFEEVKTLGVGLAKKNRNKPSLFLIGKLIEKGERRQAKEIADHLKEEYTADVYSYLHITSDLDDVSKLPIHAQEQVFKSTLLDKAPMSKKAGKKGFGTNIERIDPLMTKALASSEYKEVNASVVAVVKELQAALVQTAEMYAQGVEIVDYSDLVQNFPTSSTNVLLIPLLSPGHVTRLLIRKESETTCSLTLYNTGEGLEHHPVNDQDRYQTFISYNNVPMDALQKNLDVFKKLQVPDHIDELYTLFGRLGATGIKEPPQKREPFFERIQERGTCVASSLFSAIRGQILTESKLPPEEALMQWKLVKADLVNRLWDRLKGVSEKAIDTKTREIAALRVEKTGRYLRYAEMAQNKEQFVQFARETIRQLLEYGDTFLVVPKEKIESLFSSSMGANMALLRRLSDDLVHKWTLDELRKKPINPPEFLKPAYDQYLYSKKSEMPDRITKYQTNILVRNGGVEQSRRYENAFFHYQK